MKIIELAKVRHVLPRIPADQQPVREDFSRVIEEEGHYVDAETGKWFMSYMPRMATHLSEKAWELPEGWVDYEMPDAPPKEEAVVKSWCDLVGLGLPRTSFVVRDLHATKYHLDQPSMKGAMLMAVYRQGSYIGGETVVLEYDVAFDCQEGDVVLFAHTRCLHGNVPRIHQPNSHRLCIIARLPKEVAIRRKAGRK